ncbi:hypothetical protein [Wielerella bovis]|uniref:hypothetical protein n=1 Tax=Wielerella bovis TaxID=2917790 RepID=UPI002018E809|nr:hypothetical protein [Wielerella bovis]ULJ60813.1 hypothetical protein MIS44_02825 [Wielerella bovis]
MKRPNPKQILSHSLALFSGCLIAISAPVGAWHSVYTTPKQLQLVRRIDAFNCDNIEHIPHEANSVENAPIIWHHKENCRAERNSLLLMEIWATDPMAGVVYE